MILPTCQLYWNTYQSNRWNWVLYPIGYKLNREAGEMPARSRHCNRGIRQRNATGHSREGAATILILKPGDLPGLTTQQQPTGDRKVF